MCDMVCTESLLPEMLTHESCKPKHELLPEAVCCLQTCNCVVYTSVPSIIVGEPCQRLFTNL